MDPLFYLLPDAPEPVAPYSHAVEAGGFVFLTGQLATDPGR
jgi:2-iminobutanoate/2-iminopropanoate deaminase